MYMMMVPRKGRRNWSRRGISHNEKRPSNLHRYQRRKLYMPLHLQYCRFPSRRLQGKRRRSDKHSRLGTPGTQTNQAGCRPRLYMQ